MQSQLLDELECLLQTCEADDRQRIVQVLEDARIGGSCNNLEFQLIHRNGDKRWMAVSWQPMYNDAGEQLGFRTSIRDIHRTPQFARSRYGSTRNASSNSGMSEPRASSSSKGIVGK